MQHRLTLMAHGTFVITVDAIKNAYRKHIHGLISKSVIDLVSTPRKLIMIFTFSVQPYNRQPNFNVRRFNRKE